jgi:hypothetical protein
MADMGYLGQGGQEKRIRKDIMPRLRRHVPKGTRPRNGG